ncbi:uncharacterized protein LOC109847831 [Asparagus officinalis]|uniref:uncharacterized protein LOC109847831 n=1 Tax=Asparagus officinalis TaxID=4686 RepID=UPI00098E4D0C|nr:uncharacterized protein LOC109847831 [Asparagus officinalis]
MERTQFQYHSGALSFSGTSNVMNNEVIYENMRPLRSATVEEDERNDAFEDEDEDKAPIDSKGDDDVPFRVGDLFETRDQLVDAIWDYSIKKLVIFKQIKSNRTSYEAIYFMNTQRKGQVEENEADYACPWKLYAFTGKKHNRYFKITEYCSVHTYSNPMFEQDHSGASASYIARLIMPKLKKQLELRPNNTIDRVLHTKFVETSYSKAWNARRFAMIKIFGDWEKSYATLHQYLDAIKRSNPGSEYKLITKEINPGVHQFTSVFWVFGHSIDGFKFCWLVLSIDVTHLYGKYKGVLLVSIRVDADGCLFPLSFTVVEVKNSENWKYKSSMRLLIWHMMQ